MNTDTLQARPPDGNALDALRDRLRAVQRAIGGEVSLTITADGDCYVSRWGATGRGYQPHDWQRIAAGSLDEVMAAVDALPARGEAA